MQLCRGWPIAASFWVHRGFYWLYTSVAGSSAVLTHKAAYVAEAALCSVHRFQGLKKRKKSNNA